MRVAVLASHPVQYYAPLFRALARKLDLTVFYGYAATAQDQAQAGFGVEFNWDVDLFSGYRSSFLNNVARNPGLDRFTGVDTPEIGRLLSEGNFDVVLLMGWHLKCYIQGMMAAKRLGVPVTVRGDSHLDTPRGLFKTVAKRVLYPSFLRCFDAALVVGRRNRAYWEHYRYPQAQMFDAPHCVDNAFFAKHSTPSARASLRGRLGIAPEAKVALFAGKLLTFKRPFDALDACANLRRQGLPVEFLVAGAGPLENELRIRGAKAKVPFHLLGFCNQSEMPTVYAAADTLVLPSEHETWGLVVNEALASGKAALVSDAVGCAPDLAEHFGPSVVHCLGDINDFSGKLRRALFSPPSAEAIRALATSFEVLVVAERIGVAMDWLQAHRGLERI